MHVNEQLWCFRFILAGEKHWRTATNYVTLGEIIDGGVEFRFDDDTTLPMSDIDWENDMVEYDLVGGW